MFQVFVEILAFFEGIIFGEFKTFQKIGYDFIEFSSIDRWLFLQNSCHVIRIQKVLFTNTKAFRYGLWDLLNFTLFGLHLIIMWFYNNKSFLNLNLICFKREWKIYNFRLELDMFDFGKNMQNRFGKCHYLYFLSLLQTFV